MFFYAPHAKPLKEAIIQRRPSFHHAEQHLSTAETLRRRQSQISESRRPSHTLSLIDYDEEQPLIIRVPELQAQQQPPPPSQPPPTEEELLQPPRDLPREERQPTRDFDFENNNVPAQQLPSPPSRWPYPYIHPLHPLARAEAAAASPESLFSITEARRLSKIHLHGHPKAVILRRPTIVVKEDGQFFIQDHVATPWDGVRVPPTFDDDTTVITDTLKEDAEKENMTCPQKTIKYIKILTPHIILVSVLIGYLCLGAWVLMSLETRQELMNRSKKLIRLTNLMTNLTADSWRIVNDAQTGVRAVHHSEWAAVFREYLVSVSEVVDDRRPIRKELQQPDNLDNMHNKWTFPTALLYVLTVLTTCGYGEVSVDTDVGKIFAVIFALVGIPLMFITAADIGKFLSETLLKLVNNWNRFTKRVKNFCLNILCRRKMQRKSLHSASAQLDELDELQEQSKLWFPIGAYVACICIYCSMGSFMFINWERHWSFIHAFHFGFNLIVTVGLGDLVVTDYMFLSLIVAFVIVGLSVVTMCVDLASTHLKAYFTRIHYFGRAKKFLGMSEEIKEIVALLGAMRKKKGGKVTWNDVRDFLDNELRDRPFEPHELLMKLRYIDETSSGMSTIRHNSFQSDFFRENEYWRRLFALRPDHPVFRNEPLTRAEQPAYL